MKSNREIVYALDFDPGKPGRARGSRKLTSDTGNTTSDEPPVPRIARLIALTIFFEEMIRENKVRDYAEIARLGHVTRARLTQIMQLAGLAPDIQEHILFMAPAAGLNERNLRPVTRCIDWGDQRRLFRKMFGIELTVGSTEVMNVLTAADAARRSQDDEQYENDERSHRRHGSRTGKTARTHQGTHEEAHHTAPNAAQSRSVRQIRQGEEDRKVGR
jgi:hypothetical protein